MNKIKFALKNSAVLALIICSFIACDEDFASVGSDIIGQNDFGVTSTKEYSVIAYTNPLEPVQTNNLPLNYLGAYDDPLYGLTTASFVSQMSSALYNPSFGNNVAIDSVVMTVPYFSRRIEVNDEGETIYELDSIFGGGMIDLAIYENTYFLNSIDPTAEFNSPLTYFSNSSNSNSVINPALLTGPEIPLAPGVNPLSNYNFSNKEIQLWDEDDEITERLAPALRVKLDTLFWHNKIISKEGQPELSNANNFNNYFRGIYIRATPVDGDGSMALLNFGSAAANITIYYSKDPFTVGTERAQSTYVLTFTGNRVNLLSNQFNFSIPQGDPVLGDEKLYLKGGEGSTAVVDIFKAGAYENGISPEFTAFKNDFVETDAEGKFIKSKRLVNEANLVFYVDQTQVQGNEPDRIYLYDLNNNTPLVDYFLDATNTGLPNNSKVNHLGALQREGGLSSGAGIKYKLRITEHINSLLLRDSTNVKFGLAVSGNINLENNIPQYKVLTTDDDIMNKVPISSILTPKGTVLYGNNSTNEQKKLYLEIFYTEPNN
jgi:hypothetical protein